MRSRPIVVTSLVALAALCVSCSRDDRSGSDQRTESADVNAPPNISPAAAPGVAFDYNYDFNLSDGRIAATQEAHAAACERLGLERCRITGMTYSVNQNEQVTAELDLKLDPRIARQFGKSAQQLVESSNGKLVRLEIGSSDEGAKIDAATKRSNDVAAQEQQLQQELAKTKPGTEARASLVAQIQALQQQSSTQARTIETSQATLASTPMELHYYGDGGVPGFRGNPVREAWHTFIATIVWLVGMLLQALAVLVPLGLLIGIFVALWRTRSVLVVRRWIKGRPEGDDVDHGDSTA